jgi:hypothetical protein
MGKEGRGNEHYRNNNKEVYYSNDNFIAPNKNIIEKYNTNRYDEEKKTKTDTFYNTNNQNSGNLSNRRNSQKDIYET